MPSLRAGRALDVLNIVLADVRYGLGPYGAIYLMSHAWDEASLALAASFGGVVGLLSQVAIGAMVDGVRAKRALLTAALLVVAATCLLVVLVPRFWPVVAAGVVGALAGHTIAITVAAISLGIVGPARFAHRAARNEALFHTGNICVNLAILITAPLFGIAYPSAEGRLPGQRGICL
jgi:predicted MFS family arabinose efflux permease